MHDEWQVTSERCPGDAHGFPSRSTHYVRKPSAPAERLTVPLGTLTRDGSLHGSGHSVLELSPVVAAAKLQDPDYEGVTKRMRLHNAVAVRRR
jgi:hypothetical protein